MLQIGNRFTLGVKSLADLTTDDAAPAE